MWHTTGWLYPSGQILRCVYRQPHSPTNLSGKTQQCSLTNNWILQGVASSMYPPESLGDFTQTLFLQGKTSQSIFRCKLALFLYCILDRQSGAGGHKINLESFRCISLFMCAFCQSFVCLVFRPQQTTPKTYTSSSTEGHQLYQLYHDYMQSSKPMSPAHTLNAHCTAICKLCHYLFSLNHCIVVCLWWC